MTSCTSPPTPTLEAQFVGQGSDAAPDETGQAYYKVCAGAPVNFWFELRNTGTASWVDWGDNGNAIGQRVRLGVPEDQVDPFTQNSRISLNDATNPDVHPPSWDPPGPDCNDQAFCQRTVFSKDGGIHAIAPTISGIHKTTWRLLDEGRAWFGPEMYLSFRVENCEPEEVGGAGGSPQGGAGGSDAGAELGGSAGIPSGGTTSSGGTSSSGGTTPFGGASTAGEKSGQKAGETGEKSKEISHIFTQKESEESGGCALQPASHFSAKQQGGWLLLLGLGWRMRRDRRKKVS